MASRTALSKEDNVIKAVYIGDQGLLQLMISEGVNVNFADSQGVTPAHIAASQVHLDCLRTLVENKARINVVDRLGRTPLHFAVKAGNTEVIEYLLKHGADVHVGERTEGSKVFSHQRSAEVRVSIGDDLSMNVRQRGTLEHQHFRSDLGVRRGRWVYEAIVLSPLLAAFGWSTLEDVNQITEDDEAWMSDECPVPGRWQNGDIAATVLDLEKGTVGFYKNGALIGGAAAFEGIETNSPLFPTLTLGSFQGVSFNFGQTPFKFQYDDAAPLFSDPYESSLIEAARVGDAASVRALLDAGAAVNARNWRGCTALHAATIRGDEEIVESTICSYIVPSTAYARLLVLLEKGADCSLGDAEGMNALHHAARVDVDVTSLIARMARKKAASSSVVLDAVDDSQRSPAHHAAMAAKIDILEFLFAKKSNMHLLDRNGCNLLHCVAMSTASEGIQESVNFLVKKGFGVSAQDHLGNTPLSIAVAHGNLDAAKALLKRQANTELTDKMMRTALHIACSQPKTELLTILIDHGASIHKKSKFSMAPMMHAAMHGNAAVVKVLLAQSKIQVNPENDDGLTPLHVSSHFGFAEIVSLLLKAGADPNAKDRARALTPLHTAADQGLLLNLPYLANRHFEIVRLLLEHDADVNVLTSDSLQTSLHKASAKGHFECAQLLLKRGALCIIVFDSDGFTALDLASSNTELAMALITHGANPKLNQLNAEWLQPHVDGEMPPGVQGAVLVRHNNKLLLTFGGFEMGLSDVYSMERDFNSPNSFHWKQLNTKGDAPDARNFHAAVQHFGRLFVFGGRSSNGLVHALDHVHILNLDTLLWSCVQTRGTPPPSALLWSFVKHQSRVLLFGGTLNGDVLESLHSLDLDTLEWNKAYRHPTNYWAPPRAAHTSAIVDNKLFLIGGHSLKTYIRHVDVYDLSRQVWLTPPHIEKTLQPVITTALTLPEQKKILVIGGRDEYQDHFNDVWSLEWNEKSNTIAWVKVRSEGADDFFDARANAASALIDNTLYVFGGSDDTQIFDDLSVLTIETSQYQLALDCLKMFRDAKFTDIEIIIGSERRKAHKAVLSVGSDYFKTLLDAQPDVKEVVLQDVPMALAELLIEFMYASQLSQATANFAAVFADIDFASISKKFLGNRSNEFIRQVIRAVSHPDAQIHLQAQMKSLFNVQRNSDVKFVFPTGEVLFAHRFILSARCEHFGAKFSGRFDSNEMEIKIDVFSHEVFKKVVEHVYCEKVRVSAEIASDVLIAADFYRLNALFAQCEQILVDSLSLETAIPTYTQFADLYSTTQLKNASLNYIIQHFDFIKKTRDFQRLNPSQRQNLEEKRAQRQKELMKTKESSIIRDRMIMPTPQQAPSSSATLVTKPDQPKFDALSEDDDLNSMDGSLPRSSEDTSEDPHSMGSPVARSLNSMGSPMSSPYSSPKRRGKKGRNLLKAAKGKTNRKIQLTTNAQPAAPAQPKSSTPGRAAPQSVLPVPPPQVPPISKANPVPLVTTAPQTKPTANTQVKNGTQNATSKVEPPRASNQTHVKLAQPVALKEASALRAIDTNAGKNTSQVKPPTKPETQVQSAPPKVVPKKHVDDSSVSFTSPFKSTAAATPFTTPGGVDDHAPFRAEDVQTPRSHEDEEAPVHGSRSFFWIATAAFALVAVGAAVGFAKVPSFRDALKNFVNGAQLRIASATSTPDM